MELFDSHAHLESFNDVEAVLQRARAKGVAVVVTSGYSAETSGKAVEIAGKFSGNVFATVGVSPQVAMKLDEFGIEGMRGLAERAVAIGEVGLDFHWGREESGKERQRRCFSQMLALARELGLPVVVHSRKAEMEVLEVLGNFDGKVLLHCFSGTPGQALEGAGRGYLISIPPVKSRNRESTVNKLEIENIVLESDAPYLGKEPSDVALSAEMVAGAKGIDVGEVAKETTRNAKNFFRV